MCDCSCQYKRLEGYSQTVNKGLLFIFIVLTNPCFGQSEVSDDWPQIHGPGRDGKYWGAPLNTNWPNTGPPVVWKRKIGEGFSGPVASQGRVILFHRMANEEIIECLEADSGKTIWSYAYPTSYRDSFGFDNGPRATPVVQDGRVYCFGAEGNLHCLNFKSGKVIWSVPVHEQFVVRKGFFGASCSPLVSGVQVIVNVGSRNNAGIVAFDKRDGKFLWKATDHEASYASPVETRLSGQRHTFVFTRRGLVDLNPLTGQVRSEVRWRSRNSASVNAATPLVVGNLVFLSASYRTGANLIRIQDGEWSSIWSSDEVLSNHYATSVHEKGYLYGFHGRQDVPPGPSLRCVELRSGNVQWSQDRFGAGTLLVAARHLLIMHENGDLILADLSHQAFRELQRFRVLSGVVRAYPALSKGRLFVRNEGLLACVDLRPE